MRWGLVGLLAVAACGDSRYGAYFTIEGDVDFDEVELYFGKAMDYSEAQGNSFSSPTLGVQAGLLFDRRFAAGDHYTVAAGTQTRYYLPADDANPSLGAYVAAVAFSHGQPVGIAEYFDFTVPSDAVHDYVLALEPYAQQRVERWGDRPGCLVWKRSRSGGDSVVAVVHEDDRDCDALSFDTDCDDLCTAGNGTCSAEQTFCGSTNLCALGCNRGGVCAPTLCLPGAACGSTCADAASFQERLECATLTDPDPHFEIAVDRTAEKQLCATTIAFKPGIPCHLPMIEAIDPATVGLFTFAVAQDASDPAVCVLSVTQTASAPFADGVNYHMLISLAPLTLGPRRTLIVGLQGSANPDCTQTPYVVQPVPNAIKSCGLAP